MQVSPYAKCGNVHSKYSLSSDLIAMFELVWQDYIRLYPELRPAFFRLDRLGKSKGYVEVRFAGIEYKDGQRYHDVLVRAEVIDLTPGDLYMVLSHAAVHCINFDRGVFDTRNRSWHGDEFKEVAEEIGLETFWVDGFGYMTKNGKIRYSPRYRARTAQIAHLKPFKFVDPKGVVI